MVKCDTVRSCSSRRGSAVTFQLRSGLSRSCCFRRAQSAFLRRSHRRRIGFRVQHDSAQHKDSFHFPSNERGVLPEGIVGTRLSVGFLRCSTETTTTTTMSTDVFLSTQGSKFDCQQQLRLQVGYHSLSAPLPVELVNHKACSLQICVGNG